MLFKSTLMFLLVLLLWGNCLSAREVFLEGDYKNETLSRYRKRSANAKLTRMYLFSQILCNQDFAFDAVWAHVKQARPAQVAELKELDKCLSNGAEKSRLLAKFAEIVDAFQLYEQMHGTAPTGFKHLAACAHTIVELLRAMDGKTPDKVTAEEHPLIVELDLEMTRMIGMTRYKLPYKWVYREGEREVTGVTSHLNARQGAQQAQR